MRIARLPFVIIAVLTVLLAVSITRSEISDHDSLEDHLSSQQRGSKLLYKGMFINSPDDALIDFSPLRQQVRNYIDQNVPAEHSFYFEYLPTGISIRSNASDELVGASLLKLPVIMDLYKAAELGKLDMDAKVELREEWLNNEYGELHRLGAGSKIKLREASKIALRESDNTATNLAYSTANTLLKPEDHVIHQMDIPYTANPGEQYKIGAQAYSSLLKCLYYACFLNAQNSQEILEALAESDRSTRIGASLPDSVPVAHKIGTYAGVVHSDCGIVYAESRPYVLCIMISAADEQADEHISKLSEIIYEYVSKYK